MYSIIESVGESEVEGWEAWGVGTVLFMYLEVVPVAVSRYRGIVGCCRWGDLMSGVFVLFDATCNRMCCCSSSGWYRGEQDTADQELPVKEHTRVERMTDVRDQCMRRAS